MTGPFYAKNQNGSLELFKCCKDCAFIYDKDAKDENATCFMDPCPCMPVDEDESAENEIK